MDKELEKWYENQFELFNMQGWKDLMVQIQEEMIPTYTLENISNLEDLFKRKGELTILQWLVGWEDSVNASWRDNNGETDLS